MYILITGDLVINKPLEEIKIDPELQSTFESAEYRIVNLECPITNCDRSHKINKTGPHLKGDAAVTRKLIQSMKVDAVTLANNHIMDYGELGFRETVEFCEKNQVRYVGAGKNSDAAATPLIISLDSIKIAIVNIAENEWSSATDISWGANPLNPVFNYYTIQEAKKLADKVIVIIHGGHEFYSLPNPSTKALYRFFVDAGADLVVAHHTHCISGMEVYKGVSIFYGLGNFLFTHDDLNSFWYESLVLKMDIVDGEIFPSIIPTYFEKKTFNLKIAKGRIKQDILEKFKLASEIIASDKKLLESWQLFVQAKSNSYLYRLSPLTFINNRIIRGLTRRLNLHRLLTTKKGLSTQLNILRCESHNYLSRAVLTEHLKRHS